MSGLPARVTPALLKSKDVAAWLAVSEATLSRWRAVKEGPRWVNLGGLPRYSPEDVTAYIESKAQ